MNDFDFNLDPHVVEYAATGGEPQITSKVLCTPGCATFRCILD